jgi:putative protease
MQKDPARPHTPELLAPAGNLEKLRAAVTYGAKAVYLGGAEWSLRAAISGFTIDELREGLDIAHAAGVRVYYCLNALPRQQHISAVGRAMEQAAALGVDAFIIADPGVFSLARRGFPEVPIHLSTQANTANAEGVLFWRDLGASRINLARELSAREIRDIVGSAEGMELECFVHGAQCMAVSGRCHLSAHHGDRDANLGRCSQPCRFHYQTKYVGVEEKLDPGRVLWEVVEEEGFTNFFAAEDLCLAEFMGWFARQGIRAVKIEGRMKSAGYVARSVDVYATALADAARGKAMRSAFIEELRHAAARTLSTGFFLPKATVYEPEPERPILGWLSASPEAGVYRVQVRHKWDSAMPIRILVPGMKRPLVSPDEYGLEKPSGEALSTAHSGLEVIFRCEHPEMKAGLYLSVAD